MVPLKKVVMSASERICRERFKLGSEIERYDRARICSILSFGFSVASSFDKLNSNRWMICLRSGKSLKDLHEFCGNFLKGNPFPGTDPIFDGPTLLRMFRGAENAGIVDLELQMADGSIPERGMNQFKS